MNAVEQERDVVEARLAVYRFLAAALNKPTAEQHEWFSSTGFRTSLEQVCASFGAAVPEGELAATDPADHEARYIACFEVGLPTPPVVLLASHYNRREPVTAVIHERILFYHRFGARLSASNREPADHLLSELAFLLHLDELFLKGLPADSLLLARRDFLHRHATRWPARAAAEADEKGLPTVYRKLLAILAAAVEEDLKLTEDALAQREKKPMNPTPTMLRTEFDELLAQHQELIHLANDLEYQVYRLGEQAEPGPVSDCQQAAGALIGLLRTVLFRHDQRVLPVLEALASKASTRD